MASAWDGDYDFGSRRALSRWIIELGVKHIDWFVSQLPCNEIHALNWSS